MARKERYTAKLIVDAEKPSDMYLIGMPYKDVRVSVADDGVSIFQEDDNHAVEDHIRLDTSGIDLLIEALQKVRNG